MKKEQLERAKEIEKTLQNLNEIKIRLSHTDTIELYGSNKGSSSITKWQKIPARGFGEDRRSTSALMEEIIKTKTDEGARAIFTETVLYIERLVGIMEREIEKLNQEFNAL